MHAADFLRFTLKSLTAYPLRSLLTALGITIGIAAVVLLTSIGKGIQRFVLAEFTQFGTHLIAVIPGKTTTHGIPVGAIGTVRPLTIEDSQALARLPEIAAVVPVVQGNARVEAGKRARRSNVFGVGPQVPRVWSVQVASGRFLPKGVRHFAVLGSRLKRELFPHANPLNKRIRVGGERYRIIGVMAPKGQFLGFDLDDSVYIPASRALDLFDRESLMEIDLLYHPQIPVEEVVKAVKALLVQRHKAEDFTIITQEQMLDVLGNVLEVLTFAVGALGGISLLVGGVGILTIMTIAVTERVPEVGLLRALGTTRGQVLSLFLGESVVLASLGGLAGLALGAALAETLVLFVPGLPVHIPWAFALLAVALAGGVGLLAGVLPAYRAARLDPVEALREE